MDGHALVMQWGNVRRWIRYTDYSRAMKKKMRSECGRWEKFVFFPGVISALAGEGRGAHHRGKVGTSVSPSGSLITHHHRSWTHAIRVFFRAGEEKRIYSTFVRGVVALYIAFLKKLGNKFNLHFNYNPFIDK